MGRIVRGTWGFWGVKLGNDGIWEELGGFFPGGGWGFQRESRF